LASAGTLYWYALHITRATQPTALVHWQPDYQQALVRAQQQNKWLLIDIGAPYCSICKAIDHCIFNNASIAPLINAMVPIHIDASSSPDYQALHKQYHIVGVPTILIINPHTSSIQKRLGAELYTTETSLIIQLFQELVQEPPVRA
jgi:thiol:disulfide interchange protein